MSNCGRLPGCLRLRLGSREKSMTNVKIWKLGGRVTEGNRHSCSFARDLSESEVDDLRIQFDAIHELAEQRDLSRVVESGERWGAILDAAQVEIEFDGRISNRSQRVAWLELNAFVRLGGRLVKQLTDWATDLPMRPQQASRKFDERRDHLQRTGPYALLVEAFREEKIARDLLQPRKALDPFFIRGFEAYGARDLVATALGEMVELSIAYFALREPSYRQLANEMKSFTLSVSKGMPSIFAFVEADPNLAPTKYEMTDFPVLALARLDQAFDGVIAGRGAGALLEMLQGRYKRRLSFGDASADSAAIGGRSSGGINAVPTATVKLDVDLLGSEPVDYWAPVRDRVQEGGDGRDMFTGVVQQAVPDRRVVSLECEGAVALLEQLAGGTLAPNMQEAELLRAMERCVGLDKVLPLSEEAPEPTEEPFEIVVPLSGINVQHAIAVGNASLIPKDDGAKKVARLDRDDVGESHAALIDEFERASCYFVSEALAATIDEAENLGLLAIDTALAWLITRGRYGAATLPNGDPQSFDRQKALRAPRRGPVVLVVGTKTKRFWLRRPDPPLDAVGRRLDAHDDSLLPRLPAQLEVNDRLALLALRLAASEIDPLMQVRALWQAIESYAEKRKGEQKLFDKRAKKMISKRLLGDEPLDLNERQRKRLEEAIENLNRGSLRQRLERRLKEDAVLVTEDELTLLQELYDIRNDVVHGRSVDDPPERDKINYGISIVARMLVHRVAAVGS